MGVIHGDRFDEQKNSLDNYSKPETRWDVLSEPYEKSHEKAGQYALFTVGVIAGIGRLTSQKWVSSSKPTPINSLPIVTAVSALTIISGLAWKCFNKWRESHLLQDRAQIGKEIEKSSLPGLRTKYSSSFALSDQELNQWVRYLAAKDPFDQFLQKQTEKIFELNLDAEAKSLLKKKYQDYLRRSDNAVAFQDLKKHKAFQTLLSGEEKEQLQQFIAVRETDRLLTINGSDYAEFISKQGIDILAYLDSQRLQRLAPGFVESIYQRNIGILQVQKEHAVELKRFDVSAVVPLLQNIAERESQNSYEDFKTRNGAGAIELITKQELKQQLSDKFILYAVRQNIGIVQAQKNFAEEIQRFGSGTEQKLVQTVFNNEADQLSKKTLTYKEYRKRNGIGTIEKTSSANPQWIHFHREHFLLLPYNDLVNPEFQRDRHLFYITGQDIQTTLWNRWSSMSLKDVLATEGSGFTASMQGTSPFFNPREWTAKAVIETQNLSVYEIIKIYPELFRVGVLTAADGNLWQRLLGEIAPITSWTDFMDRYGTFVFEYRLLDYSGAARLVHRFIDNYAERFVSGQFSKEFSSRYIAPLKTYSLLHPSLSSKIDNLRERKSVIEKTFNEWKILKDQESARQTEQTLTTAGNKIHHLERHADLPRKQREKTEAAIHWQAKKSAYEDMQQAFDLDAAAIQQLSRQISDLKENKLPPLIRVRDTLLEQNPQNNYPVALTAATTAASELKKAEDTIANDIELKDLKSKIEKWTKQHQELQQKRATIEGLRKEKDDLEKKVQDPQFAENKKALEIQANTSYSETTPSSVKKAQETLQEMKNEEAQLADLKNMLAKEEYQLAPVEKDISRVETLLNLLSFSRDERIKTLSTDLQLDTKLAYAQKTARTAEQLKAALDKFKTTYDEVERLQRQIQKLIDDRTRKEAVNADRKVSIPILLQERDAALARKTRAESSYSSAAENLARQTTDIRTESRRTVEEIQQRYRESVAEKEAQKTHALKELISELKWHLETLNSRRV